MKKLFLLLLLPISLCYGSEETLSLSINRFFNAYQSLECAAKNSETPLQAKLNEALIQIVQPIFESNGQQLSASIKELEIKDNHIGKIHFEGEVVTPIRTTTHFINHTHPALYPTNTPTQIGLQLSPVTIESKVGNHTIDKNLVQHVLLAGLMDLGIPKECIKISVQKWKLVEKSGLDQGKINIDLDLSKIQETVFDQISIHFDYHHKTLGLEVAVTYGPEAYIAVIEPFMDDVLSELRDLESGSEEATEGLKELAEAISVLLNELEIHL